MGVPSADADGDDAHADVALHERGRVLHRPIALATLPATSLARQACAVSACGGMASRKNAAPGVLDAVVARAVLALHDALAVLVHVVDAGLLVLGLTCERR